MVINGAFILGLKNSVLNLKNPEKFGGNSHVTLEPVTTLSMSLSPFWHHKFH